MDSTSVAWGLAMLLAALGVKMGVPEFTAGALLGLVGAFVMRGFYPKEDRLEAWFTPFLAVIASVFGAMVHSKWFSSIPSALFVAACGMLSAPLFRALYSISKRAPEVADKTIDRALHLNEEDDKR